jgi:hypothetical protein
MDRTLMQKALAKGTRRIDLKILDDAEVVTDAIEATCVEVCEEPAVAESEPPVVVARVRRATDAYAPAAANRPLIAIG